MNWRTAGEAATWIPVANQVEEKYGIPKDLLARLLYQESHFRSDIISGTVRSPEGACGIAQLLPEYFHIGTPADDISTAGKYLASLHTRFHDWQLGLAGYNEGPTAVANAMKAKGFASLAKQTQDYVTEIVADVPVEGVLCKTLIPPPVGSQPLPPSRVQASASPPHKSLWQSAISILKRPSVQSSPAPSPPSASSPPGTSSQTVAVSDRPILQTHLLRGFPMSTPTPNPSFEQWLLTTIQSDVLTIGGAPLLTLLTNLKAHAGNELMQGADWLQFLAASPAAGLQFTVTFEQQALGALITKLQAVQVAKTTTPAA